MADQLLPAVGVVVKAEADAILAAAQGQVPRASGDLAASAFSSGPEERKTKHSVIATCGYESIYAPAVHEGIHFGVKNGHPPKWLEHAAAGRLQGFAQKVAETLNSELSKLGK